MEYSMKCGYMTRNITWYKKSLIILSLRLMQETDGMLVLFRFAGCISARLDKYLKILQD